MLTVKMDIQDARKAKLAKQEAQAAYQKENSLRVEGYIIQPAIGKSGGAENVGWELCPTTGYGPPWYLAAKEQALAALDRHRVHYGPIVDLHDKIKKGHLKEISKAISA